MKILIISGFLGAGKTTFIQEMVRMTKRDYVIFENEFSDINIDGAVLQKQAELDSPLEVYELSNGCICCSMEGDFTASLVTIENSLQPDFLIVEPSGVAVLSAIIDSIQSVSYDRIQLLSPLAIVDATTFWHYKDKFKDIFLDQIRNAQYIQLSKTESMNADDVALVVEAVRQLNSEAVVYDKPYKNADLSFWDAFLDGELTAKAQREAMESSALENMSQTDLSAPSTDAVLTLLQDVTYGRYGDICRAKGAIDTPDGRLFFDIVDHTYALTLAPKDIENQGVFIGTHLQKMALRSRLSTLAGRVQERTMQKRAIRATGLARGSRGKQASC